MMRTSNSEQSMYTKWFLLRFAQNQLRQNRAKIRCGPGRLKESSFQFNQQHFREHEHQNSHLPTRKAQDITLDYWSMHLNHS